MPEHPEGLARSGATPAVNAMGNGMGDTLRFDQERRHPRRKLVGFGFLGRKGPKRCLL
jgi:hypothetical protein